MRARVKRPRRSAVHPRARGSTSVSAARARSSSAHPRARGIRRLPSRTHSGMGRDIHAVRGTLQVHSRTLPAMSGTSARGHMRGNEVAEFVLLPVPCGTNHAHVENCLAWVPRITVDERSHPRTTPGDHDGRRTYQDWYGPSTRGTFSRRWVMGFHVSSAFSAVTVGISTRGVEQRAWCRAAHRPRRTIHARMETATPHAVGCTCRQAHPRTRVGTRRGAAWQPLSSRAGVAHPRARGNVSSKEQLHEAR